LLIITLWLVAIVGALAVAIGRTLSLEVRLTKYRLARAQAQGLARSGVYLAMQRLTLDAGDQEEKHDWLGDEWAVFPEDGDEDPDTWTVAFPPEGMPKPAFTGSLRMQVIDEERKLNLNMANPASLLEPLKILLGGADTAIAQAVIAARTVETPPDPAEDDPTRQPPYLAKDGPFAALEELSELPGMTDMTPEAFQVLLAQASPYVKNGLQSSDESTVNLNTVTPEVLRAFQVSEGAVTAVLQFREKAQDPIAPGQAGVFTDPTTILTTLQGIPVSDANDLSILSNLPFGMASQTFLITSEGRVDRPTVRVRITAVVKRGGGAICPEGRPSPCVVAWRES
jgi:type II secretory pathway component PulK